MSVFYGKPYQGEFAQYTTSELKRDMVSPSIDAETKAKIEAELFKRTSKKEQKRLAREMKIPRLINAFKDKTFDEAGSSDEAFDHFSYDYSRS